MNLNKIKNIFNKYDKIEKLYNICKIEDEYILNNKNEKIYIYRVNPLFLIDKEKLKNNIISFYNEFLRIQNEKFQIFVECNKINLKEHFNDLYTNKDEFKNNLLNNYANEIEEYNKKNNIILNKYYIIITTNNILNFESNLKILKSNGINIRKIIGKENITRFLYSNINKVNL